MTECEKLLLAFLKDWLDWVEREAPHYEPYSRAGGLCYNAMYRHPIPKPYILEAVLLERLAAEFRGSAYPFNDGDHGAFYRAVLSATQHENPERLAWVRKVIAELETSAEK